MARRERQPLDGPPSRTAPGLTRGGDGRDGGVVGAVGEHAPLLGMVAQHQPDDRYDDQRAAGDDQGRRTPADLLGQVGHQRQEDQLPGGGACREDAHHQAAALVEPAVGDGRGEDQGHRSGAEPDQHAPEHQQLPRSGHEHAAPGAERHQAEGGRDDLPEAEAVHQCGREGGGEAVEQQVDAHGGRHHARRPAELLLERHHQRAGRGPEAGSADESEEGDRGDGPRRVEPSTSALVGPECHRHQITFFKEVRAVR